MPVKVIENKTFSTLYSFAYDIIHNDKEYSIVHTASKSVWIGEYQNGQWVWRIYDTFEKKFINLHISLPPEVKSKIDNLIDLHLGVFS